MRTIRTMVAVALVAIPFVGGCGDTLPSFTPDGGADMKQTVFTVMSGKYTVSALQVSVDECKINDGSIQGSAFDVLNDGLGNVEIKGFGKGMVSFNKGTLTAMGHQKAGTMCEFDYQVTTAVTVTATNEMDAVYSERDTNHTSTCVPVNKDCNTGWSMHLKKQ